ncbi:MAG: hypothetical protein KA746_06285 [Pyrinomonadaceae bacterium]|nr:hypothetical protein [Pyrinomonadaceae bacterium]MBP6213415.1 hypothetical protein [Pyrinomonadaceae bacterium]
MLFRPSFCANCGDKVERAEWHMWTSRRFCLVCETEFKGQDMIPRVLVIGGLILGLAGVGRMISGDVSELGSKQPRRTVEQSVPAKLTSVNVPVPQPPVSLSAPLAETIREPSADQKIAKLKAVEPPAEPVYYCGAATKKGTPCTRRVKGNVRCYQHVGMPAMVSGDKLRAG